MITSVNSLLTDKNTIFAFKFVKSGMRHLDVALKLLNSPYATQCSQVKKALRWARSSILVYRGKTKVKSTPVQQRKETLKWYSQRVQMVAYPAIFILATCSNQLSPDKAWIALQALESLETGLWCMRKLRSGASVHYSAATVNRLISSDSSPIKPAAKKKKKKKKPKAQKWSTTTKMWVEGGVILPKATKLCLTALSKVGLLPQEWHPAIKTTSRLCTVALAPRKIAKTHKKSPAWVKDLFGTISSFCSCRRKIAD